MNDRRPENIYFGDATVLGIQQHDTHNLLEFNRKVAAVDREQQLRLSRIDFGNWSQVCHKPGDYKLTPADGIRMNWERFPLVESHPAGQKYVFGPQASRNPMSHRRRYNPPPANPRPNSFSFDLPLQMASDSKMRTTQASIGGRTFLRPRPIFVLSCDSRSDVRPAVLSCRRKRRALPGRDSGLRGYGREAAINPHKEQLCAAPRFFVGTGPVQRRIISWGLARWGTG
jgi:hypothetical protein